MNVYVDMKFQLLHFFILILVFPLRFELSSSLLLQNTSIGAGNSSVVDCSLGNEGNLSDVDCSLGNETLKPTSTILPSALSNEQKSLTNGSSLFWRDTNVLLTTGAVLLSVISGWLICFCLYWWHHGKRSPSGSKHSSFTVSSSPRKPKVWLDVRDVIPEVDPVSGLEVCLGVGIFGPVTLATLEGQQVAVKVVVPPLAVLKAMMAVQDSDHFSIQTPLTRLLRIPNGALNSPIAKRDKSCQAWDSAKTLPSTPDSSSLDDSSDEGFPSHSCRPGSSTLHLPTPCSPLDHLKIKIQRFGSVRSLQDRSSTPSANPDCPLECNSDINGRKDTLINSEPMLTFGSQSSCSSLDPDPQSVISLNNGKMDVERWSDFLSSESDDYSSRRAGSWATISSTMSSEAKFENAAMACAITRGLLHRRRRRTDSAQHFSTPACRSPPTDSPLASTPRSTFYASNANYKLARTRHQLERRRSKSYSPRTMSATMPLWLPVKLRLNSLRPSSPLGHQPDQTTSPSIIVNNSPCHHLFTRDKCSMKSPSHRTHACGNEEDGERDGERERDEERERDCGGKPGKDVFRSRSSVILDLNSASPTSSQGSLSGLDRRRKGEWIEEWGPSHVKEVEAVMQLRHNHIVTPLGAFYDKLRGGCIVMERMAGGTLETALRSSETKLDTLSRLRYLVQIADALQYLHEQFSPPVVHGNVRAANILLSASTSPPLAKLSLPDLEVKAGLRGNYESLFWTAPECLEEEEEETICKSQLTPQCDVFSFGITIWEVFSEKSPYANLTSIKPGQHILKCIKENNMRPELTKDFAEGIPNLIKACWHPYPSNRPMIRDVKAKLFHIMLTLSQRPTQAHETPSEHIET